MGLRQLCEVVIVVCCYRTPIISIIQTFTFDSSRQAHVVCLGGRGRTFLGRHAI